MYITDGGDRILRCDANGLSASKAIGERGVSDGQLENPRALFVYPNGDTIVVDSWNQKVKKFAADGSCC